MFSSIEEVELIESLRRLILQTIDEFWVEHLETMSYLRNSVNLRAYGQRDPLIEYQKEGKRLFNEMQFSVDEQIKSTLPNLGAGAFAKAEEQLKKNREKVRLVSADNVSNNIWCNRP